MAEENVFIEGLGPNLPQWSTEATLRDIKNILAGENKLTADVSRKLDAVAKGEAATLKVLRQTIQQTSDSVEKAVDDLKTTTVKATDIEKKSLGMFGRISTALQDMVRNDRIQQELDARRNKLLEDSLTRKYMGPGQVYADDEANARLAAKLELAKKTDNADLLSFEGLADKALPVQMKDHIGKLGKAGAAILTASEGINGFLQQGFEDRFNLANEIRQSGLMAGFDATTAGLQNMSEMITATGFTFGDAAAFVDKFSFAVGQVGVEKALKFANAMALEPFDDGVNMMQRFGLNFTETVGMAGTYLDTLRNANLLGKMNEEQMRNGMEDFMEGVQSTSNTLKVSLTEAAEIIKSRLEDKQVTSLLAMMDPEKADRTRTALANMGNIGEDSMFGQALIARLTAGSRDRFEARSPEAQALRDLPGGIGLEMLPMIEQFASLVENTDANAGDFQTVVAGLGGQFQELMGGLRNREDIIALVQTSPELQALFDSMLKQMSTAEDADAGTVGGNQGQSEMDKLVIQSEDLARKSTVAIENLVNAQTETSANNLRRLNSTNEDLIVSTIKLGENTAALTSTVGEASGIVVDAGRNIGVALTKALGFITSANELIPNLTEAGDNAEEVAKGASDIVDSNTDLAVGKSRLEDRGGFLFLDNRAENMFDEIEAALKSKDPAAMKGIALDLAEMTGFNSGDTFASNKADLLAAIEAIATTDLARSPEGQEQLERLITAIQELDGEYKKNLFRSQERADELTGDNNQDRNALIGEIRNLINALNNPGAY